MNFLNFFVLSLVPFRYFCKTFSFPKSIGYELFAVFFTTHDMTTRGFHDIGAFGFIFTSFSQSSIISCTLSPAIDRSGSLASAFYEGYITKTVNDKRQKKFDLRLHYLSGFSPVLHGPLSKGIASQQHAIHDISWQ